MDVTGGLIEICYFRDMIRMIHLILFVIAVGCSQVLHAQHKVEHGAVMAVRLDAEDDDDLAVGGYGVEGGYFIMVHTGLPGRSMFSLDVRLAYMDAERTYENTLHEDYYYYTYPQEGLYRVRSGSVDYESISLTIPLKYRCQFIKKTPIHFTLGYHPYILLNNQSTWWQYEDRIIDGATREVVFSMSDQEAEIKHEGFSSEVMVGFGYRIDRLMLELTLHSGTMNMDDPYVHGIGRASIGLHAHYFVN